MTNDPQPERKTSPGLAKLITYVLLALAAQGYIKSGHIDTELLGALVVLVFFWAGQAIDRFRPFQ